MVIGHVLKKLHNWSKKTRTKNVHKEQSMTKRISIKMSLVTKVNEKQIWFSLFLTFSLSQCVSFPLSSFPFPTVLRASWSVERYLNDRTLVTNHILIKILFVMLCSLWTFFVLVVLFSYQITKPLPRQKISLLTLE